MAPRFIDRILGRTEEEQTLPATVEPKRLMTAPTVEDGPAPTIERKSSYGLLPRGAYGPSYVFFSPDGGRTMLDVSDGPLTVAFIAYWYVATRWRATKIAEAPLMVAGEDPKTGDFEWEADHELAPLLEDPSPDFDMGELLETTSYYLDNTGACLWVKSYDNVGRVVRLYPFSYKEFEDLATDERQYGQFRVQTNDGPETYDAEDCVFFRDSAGSMQWKRGRCRLDVAMSWLKLGAKAQQTIYDLLSNSVWPSAVITTDKDWDPDEEELEDFKQSVNNYGKAGNKGKPFIALGGGEFTSLQAQIKDLVPDEVLSRVESIVAAVSGVPAIVLQFQIGLENSPWSQMKQAREMAYDDAIQPAWRKIERVLTRQLLRQVDDDPTHYVKFDDTEVAALQKNQLEQVQIAVLMGNAATLNERRAIMGLEPVEDKDDPDDRADQVPELTQPTMAEMLASANAGGGGGGDNPPGAGGGGGADKAPQDAQKKSRIERKIRVTAIQDAFRKEAVPLYEVHAGHQLSVDAQKISEIVLHTLLDDGKSAVTVEGKARGKEQVMKSVDRYLNEDGRKGWTRAMGPLNEKSAQRSGAAVAADMNVNFNLMNKNLVTYARKRTAKQITQTNATTRSLVSDIIQGGIDAKASTREIARLIAEATGFSKSRAALIARTEVTNVFNGAPTESLSVLAQSTGRTFTKEWSGVLDDRERDEHVAMEGETVGIDDEFSNGLQYPSEPNCRCTLLYDETTGD